ncbi:aldehyde dehydrogenase family protein [Zestomonas thermotolerans]|uniref:aldehyde dehydrogenase family protein n=1 Tax=Zestomonas thermotolerans TaxID=157784 RepID=UPI0012DF42A1
MARKLNTGTAPVNTGDEFVPCISFAGARQSGYGRGRSPHAFDRYAQPTAWFRLR